MKDCEAFMTSTIGDLPINSEGLRVAVDEINRLQELLEDSEARLSDKQNEVWELQDDLENLLEECKKRTARQICGMLDVLDCSYKAKGIALKKLKEWIMKEYNTEVY
jgi:hypothetical protein